jgi:hypothetical protein
MSICVYFRLFLASVFLVPARSITICAATLEGHFEGKCPESPGTWNPENLAYQDFQCLDDSPYSPDMAPFEYHPFPVLKNK